MLKQLQLTNFTNFKQSEFEFSKGLNLIIGENGLGKTHLLKLGYLACRVCHAESKSRFIENETTLTNKVAGHLIDLFKAERLGNLSSAAHEEKTHVHAQITGSSIPTVEIRALGEERSVTKPEPYQMDWSFEFLSSSENHVSIGKLPEARSESAKYGQAIYLSSKEMLSFFEGFIALYQKRELAFDETFYDLAINLSLPALKERPEIINKLLADLSAAVGGEVMLKGGRFYITTGEKSR